jgi:tetratricopeptide (TPR) repeat protein
MPWHGYRRILSNEPAAVQRLLLNDRLSDHVPSLERLAREYRSSYPLRSKLVESLRRQGRLKAALREWRLNTIIFPTAPNPYFQRARWSIKAGDHKQATQWLTKCLRRDKGYFRTSAIFQRAQCNLRIGDYDAADADLRRLPAGYEDSELGGWRVQTKEQLQAEIDAARAGHGPNKSLERTRDR